MGGTPNPGILSGVHDHHVLLCRLITAQGYPAKKVSDMTGSFSLFHMQALARPHVSSITSIHRGPCEPAKTPQMQVPSCLPLGRLCRPLLQGRREGAGTKVAGSLCSSVGQRTLLRVLWMLGSAPFSPLTFTLFPSPSSVFRSNRLHGALSGVLSAHCWSPLPLPLSPPIGKGAKPGDVWRPGSYWVPGEGVNGQDSCS